MGCWNKTCGLSNLHITAGEDVYVFVLEQNPHHDRCYTTAFYRPVLLPFYSKYNDYGGGEDCQGIGLTLILEGIKQELEPTALSKVKRSGVSAEQDNFDEELFFEAVHEGVLRTRPSFGISREIDFVMFRKDIVDDIIANWTREYYVGEGKGTSGWNNSYVSYTFQDVLNDVPAFLDRVDAKLNDTSDAGYLDGMTDQEKRAFVKISLDLGSVFEWRDPNKVSWFVGRDNHRYSYLVRPGKLIINAVANNNRQLAENLLIDHLKAVYLDSFMDSARKLWMPAGHEGSQSNQHSGYWALINAMSRALDQEWVDNDD